VQAIAERFPTTPVYAGLNTHVLGILEEQAVWAEKCLGCGDCMLDSFGGICPVTMCAKGLYNGPCGGTNRGSCEISQDQPCAWFQIHERLKAQGRLQNIRDFQPVQDWPDTRPRTLIQPGYKKPEKVKA
jgi:hypothetical protein